MELMDANTLYQDGVTAIRQQDLTTGRKLLTQSLKLDDSNENAWVWLARTFNDPEQQIKCLQRALTLNPDNARVRTAIDNLQGKAHDAPAKIRRKQKTLTADETVRIHALMQKAAKSAADGDDEAALSAWVDVLAIEVDHPEAIRSAVQTLTRLKYYEDADELLWRAIEAGTVQPSIYHTALDLARKNENFERIKAIREHIITLPDPHESLVIRVAQEYMDTNQDEAAAKTLVHALKANPNHQKLLVMMGEVQTRFGRTDQAVIYYNRAAKISTITPEGKDADKRLSAFPPVLTDKERGSILLASREVLGIVFFYLLLAWQDVGLDLANMDVPHIFGVILSGIGGYLLITATSSPQQTPLARLFGGVVTDEHRAGIVFEKNGALQESSQLPILAESTRLVLGIIGAVILVLAFALTFSVAIDLLLNPITPSDIPVPGAF